MVKCPKCDSSDLKRIHYEPKHTQLGHLDGKQIGKSTTRCQSCGHVFEHYTEFSKQYLKGKRLIKGGDHKPTIFK